MTRSGRYVGVLLVALYCLAPLAWQLLTSLRPAGELTTLPPLLPTRFTLEHYVSALTGHPFARMLLNSFIAAGAATAVALAFGSAAAFALTKMRARRVGLLLAIVLATSMFPPIATVSPLYLVINALGLRDSLAALILTYASFALPLAIWVLANFLRQLPDELYAAARVDGCTPLQAFWRVVLPLAMPGLTATGLLVFIVAWNEFLYALTFTATERSRTVPVAIALFPGLHEIPWGEIAAASLVVTLPVLVLVLRFQRRIVAGLTAGAVKG
ncbi:MAG TPA: carbohydrate ABC transporter permease [Burkholderiales bacterium]